MARGWYVTLSDGKRAFYYRWDVEQGEPRAAVQVVHGMAEHGARYDELARHLAQAGCVVYAQDLRGHGKTAEDASELGWFADQLGWDRAAEDLREFAEKITREQPGIPLFLLGHSMGSFLARTAMISFPGLYQGVLLSGTGGDPGPAGVVGSWIARRHIRRYGPRHPDKVLDRLSFGSFNRPFKPARTPFDWLSRDEAEVDAYIADPLCGCICSSAFFRDLLSGLKFIHRREHIDRIPKDMPVLLFSGEQDPVGKRGKEVRKTADLFRQAGLQDVTLQLFPDARHELFHELNRGEAAELVSRWILDQCVAGNNKEQVE